MRRAAAVLLLAPLLISARPAPERLTLAEAQRLSAQQLAAHLLGAAGASGGYVSARVNGNGGGMIAAYGLNSVDLYKRPTSAGFAGLCEVEGATITFSPVRRTPGDSPKVVEEFWQFTRFAIIRPDEIWNSDSRAEEQERACARLDPLAPDAEPRFFGVPRDERAVSANFAARALVRLPQLAAASPTSVSCRDGDRQQRRCDDPLALIRSLSVQRLRYVAVERCPAQPGWCVDASWRERTAGNESRQVDLHVRTDAGQVDPPISFNVVAVDMDAGTSVDD